MRLKLLFLLPFLGGCYTEKTDSSNSVEKEDSVVLSEKADSDSLKPDKFRFTFQVMYTTEYCGGAYPNKEILAEMDKKRCYQHSFIRFYNEQTKETFKGLTDNDGFSEMVLPYGKYSILLDTSRHEQMSHLFDPKCKMVVDKIWKRLEISEEGLQGPEKDFLWVLIEFPCNPCDPTIKMRP